MYNCVIDILDTAKEKNVTIDVARDLLQDNSEYSIDELNDACNFILSYYDEVTSFRRDGTNADIKELVDLVEMGNKVVLDAFLRGKKEFFAESMKKAKNK